jgi:hypothetical protein
MREFSQTKLQQVYEELCLPYEDKDMLCLPYPSLPPPTHQPPPSPITLEPPPHPTPSTFSFLITASRRQQNKQQVSCSLVNTAKLEGRGKGVCGQGTWGRVLGGGGRKGPKHQQSHINFENKTKPNTNTNKKPKHGQPVVISTRNQYCRCSSTLKFCFDCF